MATETVTPRTPRGNMPSARVVIPELLERGGLIILLIALIILFSVDSKSSTAFTSSANIQNILGNQGVTGIIALAMVLPLVSGYFDLSVAAVAGLSNVACAALIGTHGDAVIVGIIGALLISAIAGCINGFLVAGLKLNGFVVTLGTYTLIGGLLQYYTKGQTITSGIPTSFGAWGSAKYIGLPRPFWLLMLVAVVVWYVLMHDPVRPQAREHRVERERCPPRGHSRRPGDLPELPRIISARGNRGNSAHVDVGFRGSDRRPGLPVPGSGRSLPGCDRDSPGPLQRVGDHHRRLPGCRRRRWLHPARREQLGHTRVQRRSARRGRDRLDLDRSPPGGERAGLPAHNIG